MSGLLHSAATVRLLSVKLSDSIDALRTVSSSCSLAASKNCEERPWKRRKVWTRKLHKVMFLIPVILYRYIVDTLVTRKSINAKQFLRWAAFNESLLSGTLPIPCVWSQATQRSKSWPLHMHPGRYWMTPNPLAAGKSGAPQRWVCHRWCLIPYGCFQE